MMILHSSALSAAICQTEQQYSFFIVLAGGSAFCGDWCIRWRNNL